MRSPPGDREPAAALPARGQARELGEHSVLVNRLGQDIASRIRRPRSAIARPHRWRGVVFRDVTKERRLKRALSFQASHDALTGLINRREFDNRLQLALQGARDGEGTHALLYVDLDQFKVVNDTCGHSAGDRLPARCDRTTPVARARRGYHRPARRRRIRHPGAALFAGPGTAHRRPDTPGGARLSLHLGAEYREHWREHRSGGD